MSILLWIFQVVLALFCIQGAWWRFANYEQAAEFVPSMAALPQAVWNVIGVIEVVGALGLILPGLLRRGKKLTPMAAACLAVELLLVTGLHVKYFGLQLAATNPATWSGMMFLMAAFIAYGRFKLRPL